MVHGNLKPENVLICAAADGQPIFKVTDYGIAPGEPNLSYMPPEFFNNSSQGHGGDVWGVGVLLYQFATLKLPFPSEDPGRLEAEILRGKPKGLPLGLPARLRKLIMACLEPLVVKRRSFKQLRADFLPKYAPAPPVGYFDI